MNDKLDRLFSVRSDDNLYNAWRDFTPPERDALFLTLWRLVRSSGYSRSDLEPVLKDALSEVTPDEDDSELLSEMLRKIKENENERHEEPDPISERLREIGRELVEKGPQMV